MATTEAARAEAFAALADASREKTAGYVLQAIETAAVVRAMKIEIERQLGSVGLQHRWVGPNGTTLEIMSPNGEWMLGPDLRGLRGKGIQSVTVNGSYHLIITYEGGDEVDAGLLPSGEDGADGVSIVSAEVDETGHLILGRSIGSPLDAGKVTGDDGVSIIAAEIVDGHLILTYSNADEVDLGDISGPPGRNITGMTIDGSGHLIAAYSSGTSPVDLGKVVGEGSGTVTSVDLSVPTGLSVTGSPITGAGTLILNYAAGFEGFETTLKTKLNGISAGATVNLADADLLDRGNHTGTQAQSTIVNLASDLAAKAPLASPGLTGTPTAPTASVGTNTTQLATTAFVRAAVAALVDSSPGALDTLNELAAALGDDPNFATTMTSALAGKATTAQGAKADTALQPAAIGVSVQAYDADTAKLDVDQAWTGAQRGSFSALTSGTTVTLLLANGNDYTLTIGHNATLANPSDIASFVGQKGAIVGVQDGTGGRTLSYGSNWNPIGGASAPAIPSGANAKWRIEYHVTSSTRIDFAVNSVGV